MRVSRETSVSSGRSVEGRRRPDGEHVSYLAQRPVGGAALMVRATENRGGCRHVAAFLAQ